LARNLTVHLQKFAHRDLWFPVGETVHCGCAVASLAAKNCHCVTPRKRCLVRLAAIVEACSIAWNRLLKKTGRIRSLANRPWTHPVSP
jgi:hypothetical protein